MIRLAAEYFFLCSLNTLHPTVFVNQLGTCVAVCDHTMEIPHGCFDNYGQSLTPCFDNRGRSRLCDAYIYIIEFDDYDILKKEQKDER